MPALHGAGTLYKSSGIRVIFYVHGQGGKFGIIPLLLAIGSGVGLLSVASVVCDVVLERCLRAQSSELNRKKYLTHKLKDSELTAVMGGSEPAPSSGGYYASTNAYAALAAERDRALSAVPEHSGSANASAGASGGAATTNHHTTITTVDSKQQSLLHDESYFQSIPHDT
jgi:hypothetical protein